LLIHNYKTTQMDNNTELKLSSSFTKTGLVIAAILFLLISPLGIFAMLDAKTFHFGMVLAPLISIAILGFLIYLFTNVCDAKLVGEQLVIKKFFKPEITINHSQLGYISSFQIKRTKYTTFEIKKGRNEFEKALIMNSRSIFSTDKTDAEAVLTMFKRGKQNGPQ